MPTTTVLVTKEGCAWNSDDNIIVNTAAGIADTTIKTCLRIPSIPRTGVIRNAAIAETTSRMNKVAISAGRSSNENRLDIWIPSTISIDGTAASPNILTGSPII